MAVKKLIFYPQDEARLRAVSKPVPRVKNKKLRQLIQDLKDTLETQPGAAIAAAQIGVLKRVTVVKFGQNEEEDEQPMLTLINPQIVAAGEQEPGFDGCLSIPNIYSWDTPRPVWIEFRRWEKMAANSNGASRAWMRVCCTTKSIISTVSCSSIDCAIPTNSTRR